MPKRQTRIPGLDDKILSLYAKGMSPRVKKWLDNLKLSIIWLLYICKHDHFYTH
ncbi:hypothetical protein [Cardinium endosymbiont of Dermatophagoides farinae]|uniref:hypothetical protein n=1 Tax=Cardinium endosymbiont of Dermatophagoides farinae TaxID=2597823 RepID=UPI003B969203